MSTRDEALVKKIGINLASIALGIAFIIGMFHAVSWVYWEYAHEDRTTAKICEMVEVEHLKPEHREACFPKKE